MKFKSYFFLNSFLLFQKFKFVSFIAVVEHSFKTTRKFGKLFLFDQSLKLPVELRDNTFRLFALSARKKTSEINSFDDNSRSI